MTIELLPAEQPLNIVENGLVIRRIVDNLLVSVNELIVNSEDAFRQATTLWRQARDWKKNIETQRKALTEPYRKKTTEINDRAKEVTEPLEKIEDLLKGKIDAYTRSIEEQRQKLIEKQREAAELLDMEVDIHVPEIASMRGSGATVYKKTKKVIKVTNILKVPEKYLTINEKMVEADLKLGLEIPGIELVEEETTQIRSR